MNHLRQPGPNISNQKSTDLLYPRTHLYSSTAAVPLSPFPVDSFQCSRQSISNDDVSHHQLCHVSHPEADTPNNTKYSACYDNVSLMVASPKADRSALPIRLVASIASASTGSTTVITRCDHSNCFSSSSTSSSSSEECSRTPSSRREAIGLHPLITGKQKSKWRRACSRHCLPRFLLLVLGGLGCVLLALLVIRRLSDESDKQPPGSTRAIVDVTNKQDTTSLLTIPEVQKDDGTSHAPSFKVGSTKTRMKSEALLGSFDPMAIRNNMRWVAAKMHVAGTKEQLDLMKGLERKYRDYGYDVTTYEYEVLLSYPGDYDNPNTIHKWNEQARSWDVVSNGVADPLRSDERGDHRGITHSRLELVWWNAYSKNGSAKGQLVYANYGTRDDFHLLDKWNISVYGKIVLMRYGCVFRGGGKVFSSCHELVHQMLRLDSGDKVLLAEQKGAIGTILYSDPYDFTPSTSNFAKQMPHGPIWPPHSEAQRGTLLRQSGDPQTPFLPSKPYVHRHGHSEAQLRAKGILPNIPTTSIGYLEAATILGALDGSEVPQSSWRGSLDVSYRLNGSTTFLLSVRNSLSRRRIRNFIAKMDGAEEPDRWVMLGNHADAWVRGAIDPGSGTATMLEVARVLANHTSATAWRPRRTLLFCQWDAEEFGLIGSTEWVEEMLRVLETRAVAYLNVDSINGNTTLQVKAVPLLYRTVVDAASRTVHPLQRERNAGRKTLLDSWRFYNNKGPLPGDKSVPQMMFPTGGSDFQRFISYAGVPVVDLRMENLHLYTHTLYHTSYEVPSVVEKLINPSFEAFAAVGAMWLALALDLADSKILPFNVEDYGAVLDDLLHKLDSQLTHVGMIGALSDMLDDTNAYNTAIASLKGAIAVFRTNAVRVQGAVRSVNSGERSASAKQVEMLNARLMGVERCFILQRGIYPEREFFRHSVLSPLEYPDAHFAPLTYALILDPATRWTLAKGSHERTKWLHRVLEGFSNLQYTVESASAMLNDLGDNTFGA